MADTLDRLVEIVAPARRGFVFTGAGISTGSKIPDFRGPQGIYKTKSPVYYQEFITRRTARCEYWEMKLEAHRLFKEAKPNAAHRSIVELERLGHVTKVATQNIDGLHQAAGTSPERLIELHGTNAAVRCDVCNEREDPKRSVRDFEKSREPPRCVHCGGLMRPDVVMFGEALDAEHLRDARLASEHADLVMSLGSSLVVTPAADLPLFGASRGAPYVVVNRGATPHDEMATLRIDDDVESVLVELVRRLGAS